MTKDAAQVPSRLALEALSRAAGENARSLIIDAEVLLSAGRWPRAYSLAVLAHEEFGKSLMAMALLGAPEIVLRQPRWMRELRSGHGPKLISTYQHQAMVSSGDFVAKTNESPDLARTSNLGKQRGFYVDLADDQSVLQPSDVSEAEARAEVARVSQIVRSSGLRSMPFWLPSACHLICSTCSTDIWAVNNDEPSVMALKSKLARCQAKGHQASSYLWG